MAIVARAALKVKFESGDAPTESDFVDLIDSSVNMAEEPPQVVAPIWSVPAPATITGLVAPSWVTIGITLYWPGTDSTNPTPEKGVVIYGTSGATYDLRIYDKTNSTVIASRSGLSSASQVIQTLGNLSNLSVGPAIWEVQWQGGALLKNLNVYSLAFTF